MSTLILVEEDDDVVVVPEEGSNIFFRASCGMSYAGSTIGGFATSGWEKVRRVFEDNFSDNLELGAQLTVFYEGIKVVDLYGRSSTQKAYDSKTLQNVWSSGKNMEAICIMVLVDRGLIKYDDPVAQHWPEFGKSGKDGITISDVLRHEGGLSYLADPDYPSLSACDMTLSFDDIRNIKPMEEKIERAVRSGERRYHLMSRGTRCIDKLVGIYLHDELCL
jgi:CubicO group peptidase (beta-lactamase class C family)